MDEEIFQINVGVYNGGMAIKTRLWPYILMSTKWLIETNKPSSTNLLNGLGLIIINNLAIATEALITDIIVEYLESIEPKTTRISNNLKRTNKDGWYVKQNIFDEHFPRHLETYTSFESVKILFHLRDNISHGKSHTEISKQGKNIESINKQYQIIRNYLLGKNVIQNKNTSSNDYVLWTFEIGLFFRETMKFLHSVVNENDFYKNVGIESELKIVLHNKY